MHPFDIVDEFERVVADYAGAPYGVAVDSCTNALFLSLMLWRIQSGCSCEIILPSHTYVGVAHAVVNAGHRCYFDDYAWSGAYALAPINVIDSARRFTKRMYRSGMWCLSFHWAKHLPIGRGGMILLDNEEDYKLLRRMRYDGRTERVAPNDDMFDIPGYHCVMHPDDAARGLMLMTNIPDYNEDLPMSDYADLSKYKYFIEANR